MTLLVTGCARSCASSGEVSEDQDEDAPRDKKKKADKDKDDAAPATDKPVEAAAVDFDALFGKDPSFGGSVDTFGEMLFGASEHSEIEPGNFSAGWVGRESYEILQRARKKEYPYKQVRTASGRVCLVFTDANNMVRRAMLATRANAPTEELAFSAAGGLIFWYRHNHGTPTVEDWAYFHRGNNLMLYQTRHDGGERIAQNPDPNLSAYVLGGANECVALANAANPRPGSAPVVPAPAPATEPQPGGGGSGLFHGAFAFSESASAWRVSYNQVSEDAAKQSALSGCTQGDCQIRATFGRGQCISVIHGPAPLVTWGWGDDNNAAQVNALEQCTKRGHASAQCSNKGTWCNER
jgi:hypothetical protein